MTGRKLFPVIHIHPILIIFLFIGFITGTFMEIVIMLGIVLFHELGHYIMATSFQWRIKSITLWVFGGVMDTDEHGNRPVYEEALVSIAGPLQHVFIYLFIFITAPMNVVSSSTMELILYYNNVILLFNLLPVWPLDGGKCLFTLLSAFIPYKKAHTITILTSVWVSAGILITQLFILPFTLSSVFILLFILLENRTEWKQRYYVFLRFLSKRFYGTSYAKKSVPIYVSSARTLFDVFSLFIRERKHVIYISNQEDNRSKIDEEECLRAYFHEKQYSITVGEVKRMG
ncbi:stage IV sporulation protein FB [Virgibacillus phasianinus]|uniref:Stage IV sporulation protein FB n=1 Tax=Virgibacillus phasianinus TaxID=2017483 RepID=A0A220U5F6_9BACI|nr:M50 family metallopeptidase [Virgibacillus phasianinus]ASK63071.1 stage IV sporulation protein FB [Virgibacillus phasianinus]